MFDMLFLRDTHPLTAQIAFLYQIFSQSSTTGPYVIPIDPAARFVKLLHIFIWMNFLLAFILPVLDLISPFAVVA
jgi:hypothetical protein